VRCRRSGLVIAHSDSLLLADCTFRVSEPGRQRVLKSGHRNVHAVVWGHLVLDPLRAAELMALRREPVSYNPFRGPLFIDGQGRPVASAKSVLFHEGRCWVEGVCLAG